MSSQIPPNPYFSGINYNPSFFSTVAAYLTEAIANSKYLKLLGGSLGGFLGILRNPARVALDVNGKAVINDGTTGTPANGQFGGAGTKLILAEGGINTPIALGTDANDLWYGVSGSGAHRFYSGTNERLKIDSSGTAYFGGGNHYFGALDTSGLRLEKNTIFTNTLNGEGITIWTQNTAKNIKLGFFGGNNIIVTINNASVDITQQLNLNSGNLQLNSVNGNNVAIAPGASAFSTSAATGDMVIRSIQKLILQSGSAKAAMVIGTNNNIALGIDTATTYPITIGSSTGGTQTGPLPTYALAGVSIYAGNQTPGINPFVVLGIMNTTAFAGGFYLYSDERIKTDIKPLENSLDLIEKINPISFKYIDFVKNGTINNYGVIAQEIEKIIPEVVNSHKDYIPNIFKNADKYDNELLRLYIKTDDISIGDNIKILDIDNKPHYKKIVDKNDDYITIDEPIEKYEEDKEIFIYGKEVEDVKNVNYEALFVINIKATQELHQRIKKLEDIIKNLIN
jgi:hypothetical protein